MGVPSKSGGFKPIGRQENVPTTHVVPLTLIVTISLQKEKLPNSLLEEVRKIAASKIKSPQLDLVGNLVISLPIQVKEAVYGASDFEQARRMAIGRYEGKPSCVVIETPGETKGEQGGSFA